MPAILHVGDLHICRKNMHELVRGRADLLDDPSLPLGRILSLARDISGLEAVVLTGDVFDRAEYVMSESVSIALRFVRSLSAVAPTFVIRGTVSHDPVGSLAIMEDFAYVADTAPLSVMPDGGVGFEPIMCGDTIIGRLVTLPSGLRFGLVPSLTRAQSQSFGVGFADVVGMCVERGAVAVFGHTAVSGAINEHGVPVDLFDWDVSIAELSNPGLAMVIGLGHIHYPQVLTNRGGRLVYYAGSVGRYHFGESSKKSVSVLEFSSDSVVHSTISLPASEWLRFDVGQYEFLDEFLARDDRNSATVIADSQSPAVAEMIGKYRGRIKVEFLSPEKEERSHLRSSEWHNLSIEDLVAEYYRLRGVEPDKYVQKLMEIVAANGY